MAAVGGDAADGFMVWRICHARGNETDRLNGTWGWKVLRIWDTIGIILIQGGRGAGVSGSEEGCDVWS